MKTKIKCLEEEGKLKERVQNRTEKKKKIMCSNRKDEKMAWKINEDEKKAVRTGKLMNRKVPE